MTLPYKPFNSVVPGARPGVGTLRALLPGEIFVQRADGVLCYLDGLGVQHEVPLLGLVTAAALVQALAAYAKPADIAAALGPYARSTDVAGQVAAAVAGLVASAPAALNTLQELADALGDDPHYAATTAAALGNRVRIDAAQGLAAPAKAQGRANLGAAASGANADITGLTGLTARPGWGGHTPYDDANLTLGVLINLLGYVPVSRDTANAIGLAWAGGRIRLHVDGTDQGAAYTDANLTAAVLNAIAGQALYGTGNLSAGQIGAILGYAPARPTTVVETSAGGIGDIALNARQYVVGVSFAAAAPNFFGIARTSLLNNSSGGSQDAYLNADLIDVTAGGAQANIGVETPTTTVYGQGWQQASAMVGCSGLAIGHVYQLRCYVYKTSAGSVVACSNFQLDGINY